MCTYYLEEPRLAGGICAVKVHRHAGPGNPAIFPNDRKTGVHEHLVSDLCRAPTVDLTGRRNGVSFVRHALAGDVHIGWVEVVADVSPTEPGGRDQARTTAEKRIQDKVIFIRVQTNQPFGELYRKGGGVTDSLRAFRRHVPHVEGEGEKVVGGQGGPAWKPGFGPAHRIESPIEPSFRRNHDSFR